MLSWQQRIDRAKEEIVVKGWFSKKTTMRGFSTEDEGLAHDWMTCSCGMLDSRIPRYLSIKHSEQIWSGAPKDEELCSLGHKFYQAVRGNEIVRAEILYHKVQNRAAYLIEEIEAKEAKKATKQEETKTGII